MLHRVRSSVETSIRCRDLLAETYLLVGQVLNDALHVLWAGLLQNEVPIESPAQFLLYLEEDKERTVGYGLPTTVVPPHLRLRQKRPLTAYVSSPAPNSSRGSPSPASLSTMPPLGPSASSGAAPSEPPGKVPRFPAKRARFPEVEIHLSTSESTSSDDAED